MDNQIASVYWMRPSTEFFTKYEKYPSSLMFEVSQNIFLTEGQNTQGLAKLDMRPLLCKDRQLYTEADGREHYLNGVKYSSNSYWEDILQDNLDSTTIRVHNPEIPVALSFTLGFVASNQLTRQILALKEKGLPPFVTASLFGW